MERTSQNESSTFQSDTGQGTPPSVAEAVVRTVADVEDCQPEALPPLTQTVDPDALDTLVASDDTNYVSFQYADHDVTVSSVADVTVD
jgi:hypothetical protein